MPGSRLLSACLLSLAALASPLAALETPLVLPGTAGNTAVIDPALGTLNSIEVTEAQTRRRGFANWLSDLELMDHYPFGERNGETFSRLRIGSPSIRPSPEELIRLFSDKPSKAQVAAGQKSLQEQLREMEKAFWAASHPYDGIVRGAFNGQELVLLIPGKHALMYYRDNGKESLDLAGYTNYGPQLAISTAIRSKPDPRDLLKGGDLTPSERQVIEDAIQKSNEAGIGSIAASDPWIATLNGAFIVVDSAVQKIWAYEVKGQALEMTSARNMQIDLMLPRYQTSPSTTQSVEAFAHSVPNDVMREFNIDKLDESYLRVLVRTSSVGAKVATMQANAVSHCLVLNLPGVNRIATYTYRQGSGIELASIRDTAIDQGLLLLSRMMNERTTALNAFNDAARSVSARKNGDALAQLTFALGLDPTLGAKAEGTPGLKSAIGEPWAQLIDNAKKAADALVAKRTQIRTEVEAEREALKKRR